MEERGTIRVRWRNPEAWEALPDRVWGDLKAGRLCLHDIPVYCLYRYFWRPHNFKAQSPMLLLRPLIVDLLRLSSVRQLRSIDERLVEAHYIWCKGLPGRSKGTQYWLRSLADPSQLLDKHEETRRGSGVSYDRVHAGIWLPFGGIEQSEDSIEIHPCFQRSSEMTPHAAGVFLHLLYRANTGLQDSFEYRRRELEADLRINLTRRLPELDELQRYGWLRRTAREREFTNYDIVEAPAGLLELLLLASVAHSSGEWDMVDEHLACVEQGRLDVGGIQDLVAGLDGFELTEYGLVRLDSEIAVRRRWPRFSAPHPAEEDQQQALDTMLSIGFSRRRATQLIEEYGVARVRTVAYHAHRGHEAGVVRNPAGWATRALQDGYELPPPPRRGQFTKEDYLRRYGDLFHRRPATEDED
jgi:hypothetical protein